MCATSSVGYSQSMSYWVEVGLKNSPTKSAQQAKIAAAELAAESIYEWSETNIQLSAIEWMPNDISPYFRPTVSISQDIPWFGTSKTKESIASATIDSQKAQAEVVLASLTQQIKEKYIELQYLNAKIELLENHIEALNSLSDNLIIRLEAGQASAWEVILLENESNDAKGEVLKTKHTITQQKQIFELLVGAPIVDLQLDTLELIQEKLLNEIGKHPILLSLEAEQKELEASKKQLDLEYAPKLNVGIHYEAAMPIEPTYLSHDMIMPSIGLSLPIWTNKKKSKQNLVNLQQQALASQIDLEKSKIIQEIALTEDALYGLKINWKTKETSIENIQDARELLWREYEANKVNFQEINRLETQLIKTELEQLESCKLYNQQQIYLEYLLIN